ncbi:MAG TPA: glucosamine-6-phosphate deaminase [Candidatus Caccousia avistercoris]|nr:glucosamine-6-phosphate deaminase [Candidatus Caccousia avistercoris]
MRIISASNYEGMSRKAASLLAAQVVFKRDSVLGLATGSTPLGIYRCLIDWYQQGILDFSAVHSVNLDEYCGLSPEHDQSYAYYMDSNFFRHINIQKENTHIPDGLAEDPDGEGARYDALIRSLGGTDIQLLGIGHTGHIGFNEPAPQFVKPTHRVELNRKTIEANARFFASEADVPRYAVTMGIGSIMAAKKILLAANGEGKAEILYEAFFGPITPQVPASILQLHPDVTVVADEAALQVIGEKAPEAMKGC